MLLIGQAFKSGDGDNDGEDSEAFGHIIAKARKSSEAGETMC